MDRATVLVFTRAGMGHAEPALQERLSTTFLSLLIQNDLLPAKICFYTEGVKLVCEGSPVLEQLQALEAQEVEMIICKTCIDYFGLADKVRVGVVGGMPDIITAMEQADKVISL